MEIVEAIRRIVKLHTQPDVYLGVVQSFDSSNWTINVKLNNGAVIEDVSVRSVINSETTGIFIEPKKNSHVICSRTDGKMENMKVMLFSEIENIHIMPGKKIQLRGDDFKGIVKAPELKTQLDKMTKRIDLLYQAINAGTPSTGAPDSGAALASTMKAVIVTPPPKEDYSNIQNKNVTHG